MLQKVGIISGVILGSLALVLPLFYPITHDQIHSEFSSPSIVHPGDIFHIESVPTSTGTDYHVTIINTMGVTDAGSFDYEGYTSNIDLIFKNVGYLLKI